MPLELCTVLDVNYLPRAVALHASLVEHCASFRLRVVCMDAETSAILERMRLPGVTTLRIDEIEREDGALVAVRPGRSSVEYCWTVKPSVVLHLLAAEPGVDHLAYIDADTFVFDDPSRLLEELDGTAVLLVPDLGLADDGLGKYLGGFVAFRRGDEATRALRWWRERCLEWCYDRVEPGRYADVKHLDDWPERFERVAVLRHLGGAAGPWNLDTLGLVQREGRLFVGGDPLVLYHCVAHWLYRGRLTALPRLGILRSHYHVTASPAQLVWSSAFAVSERNFTLVEAPYMEALARALADVRGIEPDFDAGLVDLSLRELLYSFLRWALPPATRASLKRRFLGGQPKRRGPPGSFT